MIDRILGVVSYAFLSACCVVAVIGAVLAGLILLALYVMIGTLMLASMAVVAACAGVGRWVFR